MYMDKQVKRGYNEYIRLDEGIGKDAMMDVALLVMEDGDTWSCEEPEKEVAALVFDGKCTIKWENESYDVDRPNPFDYNPSCLHVCKGVKFEIIAHGPCNIYIQKTLNEKTFPSKMYKPEDTDTWARGNKGELMGCIKRDVRTCFDLDNAPYSNMVLGEVVNLPGKWSSYPPHHHPQPVLLLSLRQADGLRRRLGQRRDLRDPSQRPRYHHRQDALSGNRTGLLLLLRMGHPSSAGRSVGQDPHRRRGAPVAA